MAHGTLRDFDPVTESIEDFKERFEFYCLANNVKGEGEHARRKKALFITLLGQQTQFCCEIEAFNFAKNLKRSAISIVCGR